MIFGTRGNVHDPAETILLDFGSTKQLQITQEEIQTLLSREILALGDLANRESEMLEKTRADKSLRSVVSILEDLEYGINIFQKKEMDIFDFSIQLKEPLPPTHPPAHFR